MPAIIAILGGFVFTGAGVGVLLDLGGRGTRMVERGPEWARIGTVDQHRRIVGAGYLGFGLLLLGVGVALIVSWS